jgi:hypothetical protein
MIFQIFNEDWAKGLSSVEAIILLIVFYLIFLLVMTIFFKLALGMVSKSRHTEFGTVFVSSLIITILWALFGIFFSPLVALLLGLLFMWIIISTRHDTGFAAAIGVSVIALILFIIVVIILRIAFNITVYTLPF